MTLIRREKICSNNKDTRWDRIRKRHCSANSATNLKTETVKRFIEIDYIGKHHRDALNGITKPEMKLDPAMVMDIRHEVFKQIPRKLPLATVAHQKNLDSCKTHNLAVEEHYIANQLQQFRQHLQKQSKRNKVCEKKVNSLLIDNREIMESLNASKKHIEDFYTTPLEALNEVNDIFQREQEKERQYMATKELEDKQNEIETINLIGQESKNVNELNGLTEDPKEEDSHSNGCKENEQLSEMYPDLSLPFEFDHKFETEVRQDTPSPLADTDEFLKPLRDNIAQHQGLHLRCVRFEDNVSVCQFKVESSTCSNTSDGIESVISELAEEAWLEMQTEVNAKVDNTLSENENIRNEKQDHEKTAKKNVSSKTKLRIQSNDDLIIQGKLSEFVCRPVEYRKEQEISIEIEEDEEEGSGSNSEQNQIIEQLFKPKTENRIAIMRNYFLKWIHFTNVEKIEREHTNSHADRVRKINIFLDKIRLEKTRLKKCQNNGNDDGSQQNATKNDSMGNIKINKKYQNKIKIQQDIIDLQRVKLERQERIIMELKLSKLSEEAREARLELKKELKSVIRSGDAKSKAKAKCLQLIGNLRDEEDDHFERLQGKALLMPKFLQSMQERALERSIKHEQAKQRRLQQEAEREAQKLALEEAKRQEDEEAKRLRIEALKEKRRLEKMAKVIKERERQRYIENVKKALDFHRKLLLKRIGMEGFKRLLQRKKDNLRKCEDLRRSIYKKTYFQAWFSLYRILKARRYQKAVELHERILKRRYWHFWIFYVAQEHSKYNVAVDYHELKLTEIIFGKWLTYTKRMQMIEESKMKKAILHHEWQTKWRVIDCWQRLPQILKLEMETEERRQRWRLKIWELLPDYTPNRDELNFI